MSGPPMPQVGVAVRLISIVPVGVAVEVKVTVQVDVTEGVPSAILVGVVVEVNIVVAAKVGDVVGVRDVIGKYVIVTVAVYTAVAADVRVTDGVMTPAHIMVLKAPVLSYAVLQNTVPAPTAMTAMLKVPLPPGNTSPRLSQATMEPVTPEPVELHKYCIWFDAVGSVSHTR